MIRQLMLLPLALSIQTSGQSLGAKSAPQQVTIDVQVCEGKEFKFWFNDEAESRWGTCEKPLKGIPLVAVRRGDSPKPVDTDVKGRARLGPITLAHRQTFRIAMGCTTHQCLTLDDLFVGSSFIEAGQNKLLVFTVPNPYSSAIKPSEGS